MNKVQKRTVTLKGTAPIMFDRYVIGAKDQPLEPWQKLYFGEDGRTLIIPAANLMSFLAAQNTDSAAKRFLEPKKYKKIAAAINSFVVVSPSEIAFLRNNEPVKFGRLNGEGRDPDSGVYIHYSVARLAKGIPNEKRRPVLPLPWSLRFELTIYPNPEVTEQTLVNLFESGGEAIGLGTYRGVYGKFEVESWDSV